MVKKMLSVFVAVVCFFTFEMNLVCADENDHDLFV